MSDNILKIRPGALDRCRQKVEEVDGRLTVTQQGHALGVVGGRLVCMTCGRDVAVVEEG